MGMKDIGNDALPTMQVAADWQKAFDYFNEELFQGTLPQCVITLQRVNGTYAYFSRRHFIHHDGKRYAHEIAMNPAYFVVRTLKDSLASLVHELVHLWDAETHKKTEKRHYRYHSKAWAERMKSVGLYPSETGEEFDANGNRPKEIGDKISHYIIDGGLFDKAADKFIDEEMYTLHWYDRYAAAIPIGMEVPSGYTPPTDDIGSESNSAPAPSTPISGVSTEVFNAPTFSQVGSVASNENHFPSPESMPEERLRGLVEKVCWPSDQSPPQTRKKYRCPGCQTQIWGKAKLDIQCNRCDRVFEECNEYRGYATRAGRVASTTNQAVADSQPRKVARAAHHGTRAGKQAPTRKRAPVAAQRRFSDAATTSPATQPVNVVGMAPGKARRRKILPTDLAQTCFPFN